MFRLTINCRCPIFIFRRTLSVARTKTIPQQIVEKNEDKNIFGTLSEKGKQSLQIAKVEKYYPPDEDNYDQEEFDLAPRKNFYYYKYEINNNARKGRLGIRKALELFQEMKSKARITPDVEQFSPLIYGCAKAGFTKKAFDLYEESLKYRGKPTKSTVTCLINACGESPFPDYALKRLDWFRDHLKFEYNYQFNEIHYRSAIKAYGKLGRLDIASNLVKEMIEAGFPPTIETFNMLFIGCVSDKTSGATLALRLFKRLKYFNLKPDIHTYHLLLTCIRDCKMGSEGLLREALGELPAHTTFDQKLMYKKFFQKDKRKSTFEWYPLMNEVGDSVASALKITDGKQSNISNAQTKTTSDKRCDIVKFSSNANALAVSTLPPTAIVGSNKLPNLLSDNHLQLSLNIEAIQLDKLNSITNRFMLFGGMYGFLDLMDKDQVRPDNKLFSIMLTCIKNTKHHLIEYVSLAKDYNIKRDLLFYDLLIRQICSNMKNPLRLKQAMEFLDEMHKDNIRPNITTFESLAFGCDRWSDAKALVDDVEKIGFVISGPMMKRFFKVAIYRTDFYYLNRLIDLAKEKNYEPLADLVEALEEKKIDAHDTLLLHEKGLLETKPYWFDDKSITSYEAYCKKLGNWLKSTKLREEEHPWEQFNVEPESKKLGFHKFVQRFKALEKVKNEAQKSGREFGNLAVKAGINERDDEN